jgi:NAD(P)-dependent dehydrogenase (short-subunit alcohol dehydrogenase family)
MADQDVSERPTAPGATVQRVAIITGASQGIGAALVDAYRKLNYSVVANSRTITASNDHGVATVAGDIADPATAEHLVTAAVQRFGRVDTLINNAGVFVAKPFTEYTAADYACVTTVAPPLLVEERVHQFGSSVGGEPEEILARRHSGAIVFFKDEREPDVVADQLHRAIDEEPRAGVFPLEIIAVFLQFVITSSLAERAAELHVGSKIRLDRRPAGLRIAIHPHR